LGILTFIYAEKLFHSHTNESTRSVKSGVTEKIKNTDCVICVYQLAKNAEADVIPDFNLPLIYRTHDLQIEIGSCNYIQYNSDFNRGPPVS
jgi:hypothetical protein